MNILAPRKLALAALVGSLAITPAAFAADAVADAPQKRLTAAEKAELKKRWEMSSDELEKALGIGHDKAYYRQSLEKMGYAITAKNYDQPDYLEYEVVKNGDSYEVQVDFENGKSDAIDVTVNMWRADSTVAALRDKDYKYAYPTALTAAAERVSDRARGKLWADEKDKLENALGIGHERGYYRPALEKLGYRVTSVNDNDTDHLEMEIVKGDQSYEVMVDFDTATKKSTEVDVETNIWEAERTEKVKGDE
jgi:uncharacterized protein YmfQ (DUF2313 family)